MGPGCSAVARGSVSPEDLQFFRCKKANCPLGSQLMGIFKALFCQNMQLPA